MYSNLTGCSLTGALGVMYYHGIGTNPDRELAFKCLCAASEKGSLYAQGNLVVYYFESRLFTRAAHCAWRYDLNLIFNFFIGFFNLMIVI